MVRLARRTVPIYIGKHTEFAIRELRIMVKPQDILVLCKLVSLGDAPWTIADVAKSLGISGSEVHSALSRAAEAGLYQPEPRRPNRAALLEFLEHGIRYAFAARRASVTRGMPTSYSAPVLQSEMASAAGQAPVVWPDAEGDTRGEGVAPLYKTAPRAARADEKLYRLLALIDALRIGGARERRVAAQMLKQELAA